MWRRGDEVSEKTFRIVEAEVKRLCKEKEALVLENKKLKEEIEKVKKGAKIVVRLWEKKSQILEQKIKEQYSALPVLLNNYAWYCISWECSSCGSDLKKAKEFV